MYSEVDGNLSNHLFKDFDTLIEAFIASKEAFNCAAAHAPVSMTAQSFKVFKEVGGMDIVGDVLD